MKLTKVDLTNLLAINHEDGQLGLVLDRGDSVDVIEIPAPLAAYEGLRQLDAIIQYTRSADTADLHGLPGVNQSPPIDMAPVQSTMANAIGYDADRQVLQIEFKNGMIYQYDDVDEHTWEGLRTSDSPGRYFNQEIRGYYRSRLS